MSRRASLLACLAAPIPFVAESAHACAACAAGANPASRFAYFLSTMSLSLLPLGVLVVGLLWLRARILRTSRDEFRERDAAVPVSPPAPLGSRSTAPPAGS